MPCENVTVLQSLAIFGGHNLFSFSLWCEKSQSSSILHLSLPPTRPYASPESQTTSLKGRKKESYTDWLAPCPGLVQAAPGLDILSFKHNLFLRFLGHFGVKREGWVLTQPPLCSTPLRPIRPDSVLTSVSKPCCVPGSERISCPRLAWCCFLSFVTLLCQWAKHDSISLYPRGF